MAYSRMIKITRRDKQTSLQSERGATFTEYVVMLTVVAVAMMTAIAFFADSLEANMDESGDTLACAMQGAC